ncbi:MAG: hypothetical protein OXC42_00590 [Gammaproteobacteria bacterium]|nr:hypothetical protein [Gammaproteobacteria bacterium]
MKQGDAKNKDISYKERDFREAVRCMLHQLALALHNTQNHTGNMDFAPVFLDQLEKKVKIIEQLPGHLGLSEQALLELREMMEALRAHYHSSDTEFLACLPPDKLDS